VLNPEQIDALKDRIAQIVDPINAFLIADIADRIATAGQVTSTAEYEAMIARKLGLKEKDIKRRLKKVAEECTDELEALFVQVAKLAYEQGSEKSIAESLAVQRLLATAVEMAAEEFVNMTQTEALGLIDPAGKACGLLDAYRRCCDFAFTKVSTGAQDYNSAVRDAVKNVSQFGVQYVGTDGIKVGYESGIKTSLDAAVRRNVLGGLGIMTEQIEQAVHDDIGADGWEISAHEASAPDHEPIQGHQYTDKDFLELNDSLTRRISTLNCKHIAFPIIFGVSKPQYTQEQLQAMIDRNKKGVDFEGRHYSLYEATQEQRRLERSIRLQRRRILAFEKVPDSKDLQNAQIRKIVLEQRYKEFTETSGLRSQKERLEVLGYGPKQEAAIAKYEEVRYHKDGTVIVTDDWTDKGTSHKPQWYFPNAVVDTFSKGQHDRNFYDKHGHLFKMVHSGDHGDPKSHPDGAHGHMLIWQDDGSVEKTYFNLSDSDRRENADILK